MIDVTDVYIHTNVFMSIYVVIRYVDFFTFEKIFPRKEILIDRHKVTKFMIGL